MSSALKTMLHHPSRCKKGACCADLGFNHLSQVAGSEFSVGHVSELVDSDGVRFFAGGVVLVVSGDESGIFFENGESSGFFGGGGVFFAESSFEAVPVVVDGG